MRNGYVTIGCCTPELVPGDPLKNAKSMADAVKTAADNGVKLLVFPENCITGASFREVCGQRIQAEMLEPAIMTVVDATENSDIVAVFGAQAELRGRLINCAVVATNGMVLGVVPETAPKLPADADKAVLGGAEVNFGQNRLFESLSLPDFRFAVIVGSDNVEPGSRLSRASIAGANILVQLRSERALPGFGGITGEELRAVSSRLKAIIVRADAGFDDGADGCVRAAHNIIAENGEILTQSRLRTMEIMSCEVDVQLIAALRRRSHDFRNIPGGWETHYFDTKAVRTPITRKVSPGPFVWPEQSARELWCEDIMQLVSHALAVKMKTSGSRAMVIPMNGDIGSTVAAFAAIRAADILGYKEDSVIGVVARCEGISDPAVNRASSLTRACGMTLCQVDVSDEFRLRCDKLGIDPKEEGGLADDIRTSCRRAFARDIATQVGGLLLGPEDMTDWALGKALNIADYCPCASIPKTVMRFLMLYFCKQQESVKSVMAVLQATLTAASERTGSRIGAAEEAEMNIFTPSQLDDFYLYHVLRGGFRPSKLLRLAEAAFGNKVSEESAFARLDSFFRRFFENAAARRSMPDYPHIYDVDLRLAPEAEADPQLWEEELKALRPEGWKPEEEEETEAAEGAEEAQEAEEAEKESLAPADEEKAGSEDSEEQAEERRKADYERFLELQKRAMAVIEAERKAEREAEEKGIKPVRTAEDLKHRGM